MKKLLIITIALTVAGKNGFSQISGTTPLNDSNLLLDFTVPDMPAFKALDANPSDILRPTDVKKFAAMISPFYSHQNFVFPKNFALEFAPWKTLSKDWTLNDYYNDLGKRLKYNSAFSLGTIKDTTLYSNKLSIGFRTGYVAKKNDLLRNALVFQNMQNAMVMEQVIINYWVIEIAKYRGDTLSINEYHNIYKKNFNAWFSSLAENNIDTLRTDVKTAINEYKTTFAVQLKNVVAGSTEESMTDIIMKGIDELIKKYKENNWNETRTDIALALVAESKDSLLGNARFSSFRFWATQAIRTGKKSQLMLGVNFTAPYSENGFKYNYSGNVRGYLGEDDVRGFLELQYKKQNIDSITLIQPYTSSVLVNLGFECRLGNNFWIVGSGGVNNLMNENNVLAPNWFNMLVASLDIRYSFNRE